MHNFLIFSFIACISKSAQYIVSSEQKNDKASPNALTVDVLLNIEHISGVDFFTQTMDVLLRVEMWESGTNSTQLVHRIQNGDTTSSIRSPFADILFESEEETQLGVQHLSLLNGKVVAARTRYKLTIPCDLNQNVPFDRHQCELTLISRSEAIEDVTLRWVSVSEPIRIPHRLAIPSFMFQKVVPVSSIYQIAMPSTGSSQSLLRTYSSLTARLHFRRSLWQPLLRFFLPTSLLLMFSWVSFYLPRGEIAARITVISASILSQLIVCISFIYSLPTATGLSPADIWCCLLGLQCLLVVLLFGCIMISEGTMRKYRNLQVDDANVRETSRIKYEQRATKHARYRESSHTSECKRTPMTVVGIEFRREADAASLCSARLDILSRTICPVVFILFTIIYFLLYLIDASEP